jgi:hypothetical protein
MKTGARTIGAEAPSRTVRLRAITAPAMRAGSLRRRWPAFAAFALLLATLEAIRLWSTGEQPQSGDLLAARLPWLVVALSTLGTGAIAGPLVAEAAGWRGARHLALTVAATATAVGIGAAVLHGAFGAELEFAARDGGFVSGEALLLRGWWFYSGAGILFGVFAGSRDREFATRSAALKAELECAQIEHRSLELQLRALEADLEPGLVFQQLDEIGRMYRIDPLRADELLDRLIAYLRSAIPRTPAAARTLADEATLVETYLRVLPGSSASGIDVTVDIAAPVRQCAFPRKVLLPLASAAASAGATRIALTGLPGPAIEASPGIEVTLRASGVTTVPGWTAERLAAAQRALTEAFGPAAAIVQQTTQDGVALVLTSGPRA